MRKTEWYADPFTYAWILLVLFCIGSIIFIIKEKEEEADMYKQLSSCININKEVMADYTIKCIGALQVEEQAWIGDTCYAQAKSLYCSGSLVR